MRIYLEDDKNDGYKKDDDFDDDGDSGVTIGLKIHQIISVNEGETKIGYEIHPVIPTKNTPIV